MKLKDFRGVLYSCRGGIQPVVVYDQGNNLDLDNGCSVEYAIKTYGDREVKRIGADGGKLVIIL